MNSDSYRSIVTGTFSANDRNLDLEYRPLGLTAAHRDLAAMIVNDTLDNPQAQASALLPLGRDKRFKDRAQHLFRNAATRVSNRDTNPAMRTLAAADVIGADQEPATLRHCIFGIDHQVGKHLPKLIGRYYGIGNIAQRS